MDEDEKIKDIVLDLEFQYSEISGEQRFIYNGKSMGPILKDGDCLLLMNRRPLNLSLGDLVIYRSGDNFIVHRFLCYRRQEGRKFVIAKADNSFSKDIPFVEDFCIGKVVKMFRSDVGLDFRQEFSLKVLHYAIGLMSFFELVLVESLRSIRMPIFSIVSLPRRVAVKIGNYIVTQKIRKVLAQS